MVRFNVVYWISHILYIIVLMYLLFTSSRSISFIFGTLIANVVLHIILIMPPKLDENFTMTIKMFLHTCL